MTLSNDITVLISAQCSILTNKDELQAKMIIWDIKTLRQKFFIHQSVYAIQSIAFSKYEKLNSLISIVHPHPLVYFLSIVIFDILLYR